MNIFKELVDRFCGCATEYHDCKHKSTCPYYEGGSCFAYDMNVFCKQYYTRSNRVGSAQ
jgi:hypothetical protein